MYKRQSIDNDAAGLATDSTLSDFSGKFPSAVALGDNLTNPTTTIIGSALLGYDASAAVWRRVSVDEGGRLQLEVREMLPGILQPTTLLDTAVGTTEVTGDPVELKNYTKHTIYAKNTQDAGTVTLTFEVSYDGTDWFTLRSDEKTKLAPGESKIFVLTDRYAYIRVKAVADASPTSGATTVYIFGGST